MSYPRKRVALACDFCRQRKRRCDGRRPVCSKCEEAGADCRWQELPVQRIDSSPQSVDMATAQRLERIEALLEAHTATIDAIASMHSRLAMNGAVAPDGLPSTAGTRPGLGSAADYGADTAVSPATTRHSHPSIAGLSPAAAVVDAAVDVPPLTIPQKHQTSTNSLLTLPTIRSLLGDFPEDYFFRLESERTKFRRQYIHRLEFPPVRREITDPLVKSFYRYVYPSHPILDERTFLESYENILLRGPAPDLESALCLVIFALGSVASDPAGPEARDPSWAPGIEFFTPALEILTGEMTWFSKPSLLLVYGLIFAGIYSAFIAQPFHSWKLIHMASTHVQLLLPRLQDRSVDETVKSQINMACWSCYLIECDRLAELNLPRSGIESIVDRMAFPSPGNPPDVHRLSYLAEISIRRLLNRVHDSIYNVDGRSSVLPATLSSITSIHIDRLVSIASELDRQLLDWYDSIPDVIKPSLDTEPTVDDRQRILRIRYFATKHIIHRPFVLYAASLPESQKPPDLIVDKARVCIESCRLYLQNNGTILSRPSQYTWTMSQSSLGAVIVLTVASLSPHLRQFVPDIRSLQRLVIHNVERWAAPESSFESVTWIVDTMAKKTQFL